MFRVKTFVESAGEKTASVAGMVFQFLFFPPRRNFNEFFFFVVILHFLNDCIHQVYRCEKFPLFSRFYFAHLPRCVNKDRIQA